MTGYVRWVCDLCKEPARHRILHQDLPSRLDECGQPDDYPVSNPRQVIDLCPDHAERVMVHGNGWTSSSH